MFHNPFEYRFSRRVFAKRMVIDSAVYHLTIVGFMHPSHLLKRRINTQKKKEDKPSAYPLLLVIPNFRLLVALILSWLRSFRVLPFRSFTTNELILLISFSVIDSLKTFSCRFTSLSISSSHVSFRFRCCLISLIINIDFIQLFCSFIIHRSLRIALFFNMIKIMRLR